MHYSRLDAQTIVSGQIAAGDVAGLVEQGVTMIVNNRPDGEEVGQPPSSEIAAAAAAAGLDYRHIPMGPSGLSPALVEAMSEAMDTANGPILTYCRSGTRSTYLWALARVAKGEPPHRIIEQAAAAGYDLTPIQPYLAAR